MQPVFKDRILSWHRCLRQYRNLLCWDQLAVDITRGSGCVRCVQTVQCSSAVVLGSATNGRRMDSCCLCLTATASAICRSITTVRRTCSGKKISTSTVLKSCWPTWLSFASTSSAWWRTTPTDPVRRRRSCIAALSLTVFVLCVFICAFWFVCMSPFFYVSLGSWVISLTVFFGVSVTNLNEPRALVFSIAWVKCKFSIPFGPL